MIDALKWLSIMAFVAIAIPLLAIMLVCLGLFSLASKAVVWAVTIGGEA